MGNHSAPIVSYEPNPQRTNALIRDVSNLAGEVGPQELATEIASQIAAFSFMLCGSNSPERVVDLVAELARDAARRYVVREKMIADSSL